jgi:hypothetical protein
MRARDPSKTGQRGQILMIVQCRGSAALRERGQAPPLSVLQIFRSVGDDPVAGCARPAPSPSAPRSGNSRKRNRRRRRSTSPSKRAASCRGTDRAGRADRSAAPRPASRARVTPARQVNAAKADLSPPRRKFLAVLGKSCGNERVSPWRLTPGEPKS